MQQYQVPREVGSEVLCYEWQWLRWLVDKESVVVVQGKVKVLVSTEGVTMCFS